MNGEMSNTDVSAKEFGALQAKVEYIKDGVDRHTAALERIENILSGNISRVELGQHKKELTDEIEQKYLPRSDVESLLNFWRLITSGLAKIFAVALVAFAVYLTGVVVKQSQTVTTLKEDIQHLEAKR
nr:MAG TPA: hypothetical protein [Caudoviricetes sp.]